MKILLPFQDPYNRPLSHKVVSGGTEQFMKSIKDNFDTIVYQLPIEQIYWPQKEKVEIAQNIINLAEAYKVDAIVSNFAQAVYNSKTLIKSKIPIMFIEHCIYTIPNVLHRWNEGLDKGHSMFLVSKWQEKKYREMAERTNQRVLPISGYLNPSYCKVKRKVVDNPEYDCGTIGRCDSGKNPFKLKDMTKKSDVKGLVITSKTQSEEDLNYYNRHTKLKSREQGPGFWYSKDKKFKSKGRVFWNLPYPEVIENISNCKTYFSTWDKETWGITSMEALSCGVPVILNSDKDGDHASDIIPADKSHYVKIPYNDKEELIKAIKSFENVDRKAIKEATWEKHNLKTWKKDFENCIDMTVDNFKKRNKNG